MTTDKTGAPTTVTAEAAARLVADERKEYGSDFVEAVARKKFLEALRIAERLFTEQGLYPLGASIKVNNVPFRVVGVLESKGGGGGMAADMAVPIPPGQLTIAVTVNVSYVIK